MYNISDRLVIKYDTKDTQEKLNIKYSNMKINKISIQQKAVFWTK